MDHEWDAISDRGFRPTGVHAIKPLANDDERPRSDRGTDAAGGGFEARRV